MMNKINRPKIILVVTDAEKNSQISALGVDILELRVDLFKSRAPAYVARQIAHRHKTGIPLLLTIAKICSLAGSI